MPYLAQTLITQAYYLSGYTSADAQGVTGPQIERGLFLLNALLNFKQIETEYIPYFTYLQSINCVSGQEKYFIPNCALIETLSFDFSSVRFSMVQQSHGVYFGTSRVNNITTLPFNWTQVRVNGGTDLYFYPSPDQNYPLNLFGKFFLSDVTLSTDLSLYVDTSYIEFLRFCLAQYIAIQVGISFNPDALQMMKVLKRKLMYMSPPDLTISKTSVLIKGAPVNFADVNFGGWRPGN